MCKANDSIITKVSDLMDLKKMIEELQNEAEALTDEIKEYMGEEETMLAGTWKVTYRSTVLLSSEHIWLNSLNDT